MIIGFLLEFSDILEINLSPLHLFMRLKTVCRKHCTAKNSYSQKHLKSFCRKFKNNHTISEGNLPSKWPTAIWARKEITNGMNSEKTMDCVNQVDLRGAIVHKFRANNWLVLTLAASSNSANRDHPKIFWYDELADEVDRSYQVGDRVEIVGRLRTSKAFPDATIVGVSITPSTGWFDAKFGKGGGYQPDNNEVLIKGAFVRTYHPSENVSIVTLKLVMDDGYTYFPQVTCFGRQAIRATEINEGATVYMVARIQTNKRESEKGPQYYQSIVCRNMRVS